MTELFITSKGRSYQCDRLSRVIVIFGNLEISFKIRDFINFRRLVNSIDIKSKLLDLSDESDYEFIDAPQINFYQKLPLCELIQLRELINGTHFAIELNSMLNEVLYKESELI